MLMSAMSNQSETSVDPYVVQRDRVQQSFMLHPGDSCTPHTK